MAPLGMIVTISNEYGCGALAIGRRVAQRLNYEFVDEQLPVVVAKRLNTSSAAVDAAEDTTRNFGEKLMEGLEIATPEVAMTAPTSTFDQDVLREVQQCVREFSAHGNVVIMGRGASAILGRREDVLRVFMHAPRDWRVHHIMDDAGVDEATATAEVDRIDRARRAYLRKYYNLNWGESHLYDLSLDTSALGADLCVEMIVQAINGR